MKARKRISRDLPSLPRVAWKFGTKTMPKFQASKIIHEKEAAGELVGAHNCPLHERINLTFFDQ
jgi:hypothetical protein